MGSVDVVEGNGAQGRIRTTDTAIFSRMLYQLSYPGAGGASRPEWRSYRHAFRACPAARGGNCGSMPDVASGRWRREILGVRILVIAGGNGVTTAQPAREIDVSAAL